MKRLMWIVPVIILGGVVIAVLARNKHVLQERRSQNVLQTIIPVVAEAARWDTLEPSIELVGSILPNNAVQVASEASGRIIACNVELGRSVRQGDVLYVLDDEICRAQLMTAQANFDKAKSDSARYWFLKQQGSATDAQWEQALLQYRLAGAQLIQARRAFNDTRIKAPINGVITAKRVDVGATVNPGTIVCEIVDASKLKMLLNVPEQDALSLSVGDPVTIQSDAIPEMRFHGRITAIAPKASDAHSFPVEVTITPPYGKLKAGMFARVRFDALKPVVGLVIPRDAVLGSLREARVFVVDTVSNTARERRIRCGAELRGYVTVIEGLTSGERVIVTGNTIVTDGTPIVVTTATVTQ